MLAPGRLGIERAKKVSSSLLPRDEEGFCRRSTSRTSTVHCRVENLHYQAAKKVLRALMRVAVLRAPLPFRWCARLDRETDSYKVCTSACFQTQVERLPRRRLAPRVVQPGTVVRTVCRFREGITSRVSFHHDSCQRFGEPSSLPRPLPHFASNCNLPDLVNTHRAAVCTRQGGTAVAPPLSSYGSAT